MTQFGVTSLWQCWRGRYASIDQWGDWHQPEKFHTWNARLKLFICPIPSRTHKKAHGLRVVSCFSTNTLQVNEQHSWLKPCHLSYHFSGLSRLLFFAPQWVIVAVSPHFLSGEGLGCQTAERCSLTQQSLWPNGGVLMAKSAPIQLVRCHASLSFLSGFYYKSFFQPHNTHICNCRLLSLLQEVFHPSVSKPSTLCGSILNPNYLKSGFLCIITPKCHKLLPFTQN